jgi:hypothetical protein
MPAIPLDACVRDSDAPRVRDAGATLPLAAWLAAVERAREKGIRPPTLDAWRDEQTAHYRETARKLRAATRIERESIERTRVAYCEGTRYRIVGRNGLGATMHDRVRAATREAWREITLHAGRAASYAITRDDSGHYTFAGMTQARMTPAPLTRTVALSDVIVRRYDADNRELRGHHEIRATRSATIRHLDGTVARDSTLLLARRGHIL